MNYGVRVPYCGYAYVEVEADSKEAAIKKALETEDLFSKLEEGDFYEKLLKGNCFYGELSKAEAKELEADCMNDDDDDEATT